MPAFPFAFWKSAAAQGAMSVTDNFDRADASTLGSNWNVINDPSLVRIISNKASQATGVASYPNCIYAGAFSFTANQYSKCAVVLPDSSVVIELIVRATGSSLANLSNYAVTVGSGGYQLYKMVNGVEQAVQSGTDYGLVTISTGDVVELRVVGSTITFYINGALQTTCTDTSVTAAGAPGFNLVANNGTYQAAIDNWEGGNL